MMRVITYGRKQFLLCLQLNSTLFAKETVTKNSRALPYFTMCKLYIINLHSGQTQLAQCRV